MIKKIIFLSALTFLSFAFKAQAVGVSDVPTIRSVVAALSSDIAALQKLSDQLQILVDNGFEVPVADSTQTVTLTNLQKQGLIAKYQDQKAILVVHFNQLP